VRAAWHAYSNHHHLTLRPEDVWFAILTQLSFHVNANAEELRPYFVAHEGQKEIRIKCARSFNFADIGNMAIYMTKEMEKHLNDPGLRDWIMPDFTTTTKTDLVTAAVLMMGAMQKYFTYMCDMWCGIPSVTLLGEKEDWEKICRRLDKLSQLGTQPEQFASLLRPVTDNFVRSFDDPNDPEIITFWSRIVHYEEGSGASYLSGWITAFCLWNDEGSLLYNPSRRNPFSNSSGGIPSHQIDSRNIPSGYASVPVTVNDMGNIYNTRMLAGSVGIKLSSSGELLDISSSNIHWFTSRVRPEVGDVTGLNSMQPVTG
jgi:hypothetical protein